MNIVIPFVGAVIGTVIGLACGEMLHLWIDGTSVDLRIVSAMTGTLIGYFAAHLLTRSHATE